MKARWMLLFVLVLCSLCSVAQSRIPINKLLTLLEQKKYGELHDTALVIRNQEYGKNYAIDYLIACALYGSKLHDDARKWLDHALDSYDIPKELRVELIAQRKTWSTARTVGISANALAMASLHNIQGASVVGKEGQLLSCSRTVAERDSMSTTIMSERLTDLVSKLIPVQREDSTEGMRILRGELGAAYRIRVRNRFIIVAPKNSARVSAMDSINLQLERVADYYNRTFGLEYPPYYVVVGAMPHLASFRTLAKKVHGLIITGTSFLGYSSMGDMTMLARATPGHTGTMQHELFHLMVRTTTGDVPPWLDEGMACSFENADWHGDSLKGVHDYLGNFRLDALREGRNMGHGWSTPSLDTLVAMSWERFRGLPGEPECVSRFHYALSKYFVFYLQERGVMKAVLDEYKNMLRPDDAGGSLFRTDKEMLEVALKEPITTTHLKFEEWFKRKFHFNPFRR